MMKYHTLSKETAEFILQKFVVYLLDDNYASRELLAEPKEFRAKYLQEYFDDNFLMDIEEVTRNDITFEVGETPGCCGVAQLVDFSPSVNKQQIEVSLHCLDIADFSLLKYYSIDKGITNKLKQLGFIVDRVWYNHGSGNKVTELTYDKNKAGFFRWPTFSDIQAVLGAEAVMHELSTLMNLSSASPAKTTKRRRSAKVQLRIFVKVPANHMSDCQTTLYHIFPILSSLGCKNIT